MKEVSLLKGFITFFVLVGLLTNGLAQEPTVIINPPQASTTTIFAGQTVNFIATRSANSTWVGGNSSFTYNWIASPAAGASFTNNPNTTGSTPLASGSVGTFSNVGTYSVSCTVSEDGGGLTATSASKTIVVLAVPPPSLWAISSNGTQVSSFTVSNGIYINGPINIFDPTIGGTIPSTAALGRTDKPSQGNGHFYWLPNTGNFGVVEVYAATATGANRTLIGTLDLNGANSSSLGFVRLGMGPDGTGWILASDGTDLFLAKFKPDGTNLLSTLPPANQLQVVDASVSLVGGTIGIFQNGDLCISSNGNIYALANNNLGSTQLFIGAPNGSSTILTKKWDLVNGNGDPPFGGEVNGLAFDVLGSLYLSTNFGLYYINQAALNSPPGFLGVDLVLAPTLQTGLLDLASNIFPIQAVLPVKLLSFSGSIHNNIATLNWETENEQNLSQYVIQRKGSFDTDYVVVASKSSLNSAGHLSYQHPDNLSVVSGNIFYYRLKMVDVDGRYSYSNVVMIRKDPGSIIGITVNPNPVLDGIATIRFTASASGIVNFKVVDMTGKVVLQQQNMVSEGTNSIPFNHLESLLPGIYMIQMNNRQEVTSFKFSVVR